MSSKGGPVGKHAVCVARCAATGLAATAGVLALCLVGTVSTAVGLAANTLLVMGGTNNGTALSPPIQQELGGDPRYPAPDAGPVRTVGTFGHGYLDTGNNPASPYFGWDFVPVVWPAKVLPSALGGTPYEASQQQGLHNISGALTTTLAALGPGERVVAFGYSSSANVMVREMRALQSQPGGAPATDGLQFLLLGNPNRPNGGILQRFAGLYIPFLDIPLDGSMPVDTPYATTDISWEYDAASDFPTYPLNLFAVANAVLTGSFVHGNYFPADINGPRAFPDTTVGNITYITLKTPHLPLLTPLYDSGFPAPLLDLIEPALTVMVDWGYDRSVGPGTPTTAGLLPGIDPLTATSQLVNALGQGVHNFIADLTPAPAPAQAVSLGTRPPRAESAARSRSTAAARGAEHRKLAV
ncbi:MAG: PE-PPE domain-containing protein, partial [Candidatus Nanopelagicales bacterium]